MVVKMVSFPFLIGKVLTGINEVTSNIIAIIIMFQLIIGKVLTVVLFLTIGVHVCKYMDSFPFLIGKVLTENLFGSYNAEEVFPFLIGKVLTTAFKPL